MMHLPSADTIKYEYCNYLKKIFLLNTENQKNVLLYQEMRD